MKERPILFSSPMVMAILEGRKSQTRRVIVPQPDKGCDGNSSELMTEAFHAGFIEGLRCPYGVPGDRLWVRETWQVVHWCEDDFQIADCIPEEGGRGHYWAAEYRASTDLETKWRSPIHMPRWASRITLEITDVRVQRVQEISAEDCAAEGSQYPVTAEGCPRGKYAPLLEIGGKYAACRYLDKKENDLHRAYSRAYFASLWDSINQKRGFGWDKNPWTWAITFRRVA